MTTKQIVLSGRPKGIPVAIVKGFDQLPAALLGLFEGNNIGR